MTGQFPCVFEIGFQYQLGYARCLLNHFIVASYLELLTTSEENIRLICHYSEKKLVQRCMPALQFNFVKALSLGPCDWIIKEVVWLECN